MDNHRDRILRDLGFTPWMPRGHRQGDGSEPSVAAFSATTGSSATMPTWVSLEVAVSACTRCALSKGRTRTVFGVGAREARWMVIGEAPGAEEDKRGEPFVGRAGKLLDSMLQAVGLTRQEVYITNIVKCRPPGNRDPRSEEADACWEYLSAQIQLVDPALLLAVGRVAAQRLLGVESPVGRMRGRAHEGPQGRPVVVTYHPAYLLRNPPAKIKAWADLQLALATANPRPS